MTLLENFILKQVNKCKSAFELYPPTHKNTIKALNSSKSSN